MKKRIIIMVFSLFLCLLTISIKSSYGYSYMPNEIKTNDIKNNIIGIYIDDIENKLKYVDDTIIPVKDEEKPKPEKKINNNTPSNIEIKKEEPQNVEEPIKKEYTTSELLNESPNVISNNMNIYNEVLNYVNTYRNEVSIHALVLDNELTKAATIRAMEMAYHNKFSHTRPNGSNCFTILSELGINYNFVGENIAIGYNNASSVSNGWRNSEGHYKNMINDRFNKIGIGKFTYNNTNYWVQLFSS